MPSRRVRPLRRRTRRITNAENIQNCIKYWKQSPEYCKKNAKVHRTPGSSYNNFPGHAWMHLGYVPRRVYNSDGTKTESKLDPWK